MNTNLLQEMVGEGNGDIFEDEEKEEEVSADGDSDESEEVIGRFKKEFRV